MVSAELAHLLDDYRNTGPGHVYRLYDAAHVCIYVGWSTEADRRIRAHRRTTPWFDTVQDVRLTYAPDWNTGLVLEAALIAVEDPVHNRQHRVVPPPCQVVPGCPRSMAALAIAGQDAATACLHHLLDLAEAFIARENLEWRTLPPQPPAPAISGEVRDWIRDQRAAGTSGRAIAHALNAAGIPTVRGGKAWSDSTVRGMAHRPGGALRFRSRVPADVSARIRDEHAGGRSMRQIADDLNTDGVPTARGGFNWLSSTVNYLLKQEAPRG